MNYISFSLRFWELTYPLNEVKVKIEVISTDLSLENLALAKIELSTHMVLLTRVLEEDKKVVELMREYFEIELAVTLGVPEYFKEVGCLYCRDPVTLLESEKDTIYVVEFPTWKSKDCWSLVKVKLA